MAWRRVVRVGTCCLLVALGVREVRAQSGPASTAPASSAPPAAAQEGITAVVTGLRSDRGAVQVSIYDTASAWPHDTGMLSRCRVPVHARTATCVFPGLRVGGTYAIAFMHDENGNGRMDYNFIGMPQEGYGFSNDVHPSLSAPSFDSCHFVYRGGLQTVRMTAQY